MFHRDLTLLEFGALKLGLEKEFCLMAQINALSDTVRQHSSDSGYRSIVCKFQAVPQLRIRLHHRDMTLWCLRFEN